MIGAETLYKIHLHLQEIKKMKYANTIFGNVTIIAVGDLYQLPPFKDNKISMTSGSRDNPSPISLHASLWQEDFMFHELKQVVRQKDHTFADLLNCVRIAEITEDDEAILRTIVVTINDPNHFTEALHVYGTNDQAEIYNSSMLQRLQSQKYSISSHDVSKDTDTKQVKINLHGKKCIETGGLESCLIVAENSVVRLTCNIDVTDGLANGVRGVIQKIITKEDETSVVAILVKFEDSNIGEAAKGGSQHKSQYPRCSSNIQVGSIIPIQQQKSLYLGLSFPLY